MVENEKKSNEECDDSLKNVTNWFFKGSVLRAIIRFSSIRQVELERKIGYSRPKVAKMLQSDCYLPKFAKLIVEEFSVDSPEELQISEGEIKEAHRNGTQTQLLKSKGANIQLLTMLLLDKPIVTLDDLLKASLYHDIDRELDENQKDQE